jgi:hypothetical protein
MVSEQNDIKKVVQKLTAEPLTHLMLGHRELFHSNLSHGFLNIYLRSPMRYSGG